MYGEYRGKDSLGDLMHDFSCRNPDEMKYEKLAQKVRYYKQETEGVKTMCKAVEDYGKTLVAEKIAEIAKLPVEKIKAIAEKVTVKA